MFHRVLPSSLPFPPRSSDVRRLGLKAVIIGTCNTLRRPIGAPVGRFGAQAPQNEKKEQNLMQAVPRLGPATWTGGGKAGAPVWAVLEKMFSIFSGFEPSTVRIEIINDND